MTWEGLFFLNSILLGVGLAMDAFSVSLANGLREPRMSTGKICAIAGVFALFQAVMPLIGWICVHTIATRFSALQRWIPWVALVLLSGIGGKMLLDGRHAEQEEEVPVRVGFGGLLLQGFATSIPP